MNIALFACDKDAHNLIDEQEKYDESSSYGSQGMMAYLSITVVFLN